MQKLLLVVAICIAASFAQSIGDRLVRTAILYSSVPLTVSDAVDQGWTNFTGCDPNLGIAYTNTGGSAPSKGNPIVVYYTGGGQITGVGLEHFSAPRPGMEKFFLPNADGNYRLTVSFRPAGDLCSSQMYDEVIGTQLNVDQGNGDYQVPLNESAATTQQWTKGGCIGGMGTHWSLDLDTAPDMSWQASNLFPVVAMYNEQAGGSVSAFFITTPVLQRPEPLGPWEGPIPSSLMCLNWCSSACSFDVNFWNTLHFYLDDHNLNTCPSRC